MTENERPESEAPVLTVPEVAGILRISRDTAYDYVARGLIPHLRLGGRIIIPRDRFQRWLDSGGDAEVEAEATGSR